MIRSARPPTLSIVPRCLAKSGIAFFVVTLAVVTLMGGVASAACAKLDWSCFDATVAVVGRGKNARGNDDVLVFCSGVAVTPRQVLTAGHCAVSLAKPTITSIDIYREALVPFGQSAAAQGRVDRLTLNSSYDRSTSLYVHDRGLIELDRELPKNLNYPVIARFSGATARDLVRDRLIPSAILHRIGFGQRKSATTGNWENRRTWIRPSVESITSNIIVTNDTSATGGDSGGPLFLFTPELGMILVGLHSTWDPLNQHVYSPRVF